MAKDNAINIFEIKSFRGGISEYENKGIPGAFKMAWNLDIRKRTDSISCAQLLVEIGNTAQSASASLSPSASVSPSSSGSPSPSLSRSPSSSASPSPKSPSASVSPSASKSPSASASPSASVSMSASVSPSISPSAGLLTVFSDLIKQFVISSDGNIYGFGNTGVIYKIDSDNYVSQVYDLGKPIVGASEWYNNSGQTFLYFATRTELHRKELPGNTSWNDVDASGNYPKTNLTASDWHTMREAGGSLIIANGQYLALVGYDDSYTNEAVDLIPGNIAKTIVERNGRTIAGTARQSDLTKSINSAIDCEVPLAQVGDDGEIYFANMSDNIPAKRFPGGGKTNPGGVTNLVDQVNFFEWEQDALSWIDKQAVGNMSAWGVYSADSGYNGIYTYGRKSKEYPFVLNLEHEMDVDEIGAIIAKDGVIYASYRDGSDFGVRMVDQTQKATGTYDALEFDSPTKTPQDITNWMYAEIYMKPLPASCSVQFWYRINKTGSYVQAKLADGNTSYTTENGEKAVFVIQADGEIYEHRLVLVPYANTTPEVYRIRTYFR